jgi:HD-like signal output (HDOD) protein
VLAEFMAESNRDEPDMRRLSHLVNKDVALAASVLKTVNSPLYGLARKARTVQDALTLLGLQEASRLIAGFLLRQAFASLNSPAMYEYWDASSHIALVAAYLAREFDAARRDEAHTFALFRDCGVPAMLARYPEYEGMLAENRSASDRHRVASERLAFGYDHALVGATLAQTWHLPAEMWHAIRIHASYCEPGFLADERGKSAAPWVALGLLAEQLHRIHRGCYEPDAWAAEDEFIAAVLGPVGERLEPLANDIAMLMEQD